MAIRVKTVAKWLGAALLLVVLLVGGFFLKFLSTDDTRFDAHAWAMLGGGGNTLILDSDAGPLVVDTKFLYPSGKLKAAIEKSAGKPVKMVINTHYHFDHTGGNPKYVGAEFMAAATVPEHMRKEMASDFGPDKPGAATVPTTLIPTTVDAPNPKRFTYGDDDVEVLFLGRGHTDGDVVVLLHNRSILHMGDLFVNGAYPLVDTKAGASVREWVGVMDRAIALNAKTVIPGHGPICTTADMKLQRDYLASLWEEAMAAVKAGKSRDQAVSAHDPSRFGLKPIFPVIMGPGDNMKAAYDEAKAWVAAGH